MSGSPLHSIVEEDKKKNMPFNDNLYTKSPSDNTNENSTSSIRETSSNKQSIYIHSPESNMELQTGPKHNSSVYIRHSDSDILPSLEDDLDISGRNQVKFLNKIEIDSDNIETPPSVRKSFAQPQNEKCEKLSSSMLSKNTIVPKLLTKCESESGSNDSKKIDQVALGDSHFDRFSLARRTRRFKRPTDLNNTEDMSTVVSVSDDTQISENTHLKKKLDLKVQEGSSKDVQKNNDVVSRIGKIGKSISRISQEDVREAIRSLKSPTPEREWNPKDSFRLGPVSTAKLISHELNDEGFEETQSLVSDTPSLTTSSCNEDSKTLQENSCKLPSSHEILEESGKRRPNRQSNQLQTLLVRNQQSLERSRSLRSSSAVPAARSSSSTTPRRTASLRRSEAPPQNLSPQKLLPNKRLDVERSNSRTSLRSSRSSLNSAASTNTVKKMPVRASTTPASNLSKKSITHLNSSTTASTRPQNRVPASRSSSSGSSISTSLRKPTTSINPKLPLANSASFKENQSNRSKISPASSATSTKTNVSCSNIGSRGSNTSNRFMRPTTSSATKIKSK
jgi:inverted formin-2